MDAVAEDDRTTAEATDLQQGGSTRDLLEQLEESDSSVEAWVM
jgi:hypothetical protein